MQLPCELRAMIWDESIPEDISEVCILLRQAPQSSRNERMTASFSSSSTISSFHAPLTVDIAFPVLMHICHESRAHAIKHTNFRFSPAARTMVPYRRFRPELDVLYVHGLQDLASLLPMMLRREALAAEEEYGEKKRHGGNVSLLQQQFEEVKHLALGCWRPICAGSAPASATCVFGAFPRVATISVVLPSSKELPSRRRLYPLIPARRARLEPFCTGAAGKTNIMSAFRRVDGTTSGVLTFLHRIRCDIAAYHARMWRALGPRFGVVDSGFVDLEVGACYFAAWMHDSSDSYYHHHHQPFGAFHDSLSAPDKFKQFDISETKARGGLNPERIRVNDIRLVGRNPIYS